MQEMLHYLKYSENKMKFNLKNFLSSPWTILGSIIAGVLGGVYAVPQ